MDFSKEDCLAVVVLTHGDEDGKLYCYDSYYNEEMLWTPFAANKCPTLAGKPKLFFIQVNIVLFVAC